jgi:DNA replication and repair protein RecF
VLLEYDRLAGKKMIKVNHKPVKFKSDQLLKFVIFTPEDLTLIKGNPSKRRKFLDYMIKQLSAAYAYQLDNYQRLLYRRNELLKREAGADAFKALDPVFYGCAAKIILQRIHFVTLLDRELQMIMPNMSEETLKVDLRYALSFPLTGEAVNEAVLLGALEKYGADRREMEWKRRTSLIGPHLDDVNVYLEQKLARIFSSQGQQRTIVVGLKLAEIHVGYRLQEQYPIFLLDEVLSELDEGKRQKLIAYLQRIDCQTFLTSVSLEKIDTEGVKIARFKNGQLWLEGVE